MGRMLAFLYGSVSYVIFFLTFLYAIGFVGNLVVSKSVDAGTGASGSAWLINLALLGLFAVQHSVMARPWFKKGWVKVVPKPVERSTYVLLSSLLLVLLFWLWVPMTDVVWDVGGAGATVLGVLFWAGWALVLLSTFLIDHFDLFGLRQVTAHLAKKPYEPPRFKAPSFYKFVRHPLLLGFIIAFWATPQMTQGHLLFAVTTTLYMLVAIQFEERDLVAAHGAAYAAYLRDVPMIVPIPGKSYRGGGETATAEMPAASTVAPPERESPATAPESPPADPWTESDSAPESGGDEAGNPDEHPA